MAMMNGYYYPLAAIVAVIATVFVVLLVRRGRRPTESRSTKPIEPTASERTEASWTTRWGEYQELAQEIAPGVRLMTKDGWFWRCVAWALFLSSLGRIRRDCFLQDYATTLGPLQAYPSHWPRIPLELLAHESRHTYQSQMAGWFVPVAGWLGPSVRVWVGLLPMTIAYGFFPVPVFLAWGRFRLELDAEAFAWRMGLDRGWLSPDQVRRRAASTSQQVAGWMYLKAWPNRWAANDYARRAEQIISDWQTGKTAS